MNHDRAPVLEAIEQFHSVDAYSFSLPGHRLGKGIDEATAKVLPRALFAADVEIAKRAAAQGCRRAVRGVNDDRRW